jgi:hypothetical protein
MPKHSEESHLHLSGSAASRQCLEQEVRIDGGIACGATEIGQQDSKLLSKLTSNTVVGVTAEQGS